MALSATQAAVSHQKGAKSALGKHPDLQTWRSSYLACPTSWPNLLAIAQHFSGTLERCFRDPTCMFLNGSSFSMPVELVGLHEGIEYDCMVATRPLAPAGPHLFRNVPDSLLDPLHRMAS
jgi:hypothetical protein